MDSFWSDAKLGCEDKRKVHCQVKIISLEVELYFRQSGQIPVAFDSSLLEARGQIYLLQCIKSAL